MYTLTVIIPVYNAATWIDSCIQTILAQSSVPDEILFVDDASTDMTVEACMAWQGRCPAVRVLRLPVNAGPGAARNAGIQAASSAYLTFIDADDDLHKDYFLRLREAVEKNHADVAVCGITIYAPQHRAKKEILPPSPATSDTLLRQREILYAPVTKCYRKVFLCNHGVTFAPCRMGEDMAFAVKLCCLRPRIATVAQPLYIYLRREGSLTNTLGKRAEIFIALDDVRSFLEQHHLTRQYTGVFRRLVFWHAIYYPARLFIVALYRHNESFSCIFRQVWGYLRMSWLFIWRKKYERA